MQKTITTDELREKLADVLDAVATDGEPYVLTRANGPEAALIPYDAFRRFQVFEARDLEFRQRWTEMRERQAALSQGWDEEAVEAEIRAVVEDVRAERWAREQRESAGI